MTSLEHIVSTIFHVTSSNSQAYNERAPEMSVATVDGDEIVTKLKQDIEGVLRRKTEALQVGVNITLQYNVVQCVVYELR